ncbi:MAG: hypothetical protein PHI35_05135, partial [Victivallaceae bacterium]|nr:hypothetical protein [Victivallaceae bacterium]
MFQTLYSFLLGKYRENEFPALRRQLEVWQRKRPFDGMRLLDGTPVFRNTLAKYLPLLAGGAELTVVMSDGIPGDEAVFNRLPKFGIRTADAGTLCKRFDVVMDCAGKLSQVNSSLGYVELTRSGEAVYRDAKQPVFLADAGRVKAIETGLGTGDGFIRAMKKLGYANFKDRKIAVFGCGKVGRGIVAGILREGGVPVIVDDPARV